MAVLSKETKSPLAPQSDDEVAKKNLITQNLKKKNDADEEKADKAKIEPVKIDFEGLQQRIIAFLQNLYAIRSCKGRCYPLFRTRTIKKGLSLHRFTLEKRKNWLKVSLVLRSLQKVRNIYMRP
jgi:hypothetical protein